jgi:hypothetical protein
MAFVSAFFGIEHNMAPPNFRSLSESSEGLCCIAGSMAGVTFDYGTDLSSIFFGNPCASRVARFLRQEAADRKRRGFVSTGYLEEKQYD